MPARDGEGVAAVVPAGVLRRYRLLEDEADRRGGHTVHDRGRQVHVVHIAHRDEAHRRT